MTNHIVIVNQASNYLTIGYANAFVEQGFRVTLMTGSVHEQGEHLDARIQRVEMARWRQRPNWKKAGFYGIFVIQAYLLLLTRFRKAEVFFISIPPMTHALSLFLPNRCSVLIWDVYPDILRITGAKSSDLMYRLLEYINRSSLRRCYKIFTITEPMRELVSQYADPAKISVVPIWSNFNGHELIERKDNLFLAEEKTRQDRFIVQYSGNIGATHDIECLLDVAEILVEQRGIHFQIIGRGPKEDVIRREAERRKISNLEILPFQSDDRFIHSLSAANVGVVALNEKTSKGSVPSKAYNLMAFGIPGLYIAANDSELARYAEEYRSGERFSASDIHGIAKFIQRVSADQELYQTYCRGALDAARDFQRRNADLLVTKFIYNRKAELDSRH